MCWYHEFISTTYYAISCTIHIISYNIWEEKCGDSCGIARATKWNLVLIVRQLKSSLRDISELVSLQQHLCTGIFKRSWACGLSLNFAKYFVQSNIWMMIDKRTSRSQNYMLIFEMSFWDSHCRAILAVAVTQGHQSGPSAQIHAREECVAVSIYPLSKGSLLLSQRWPKQDARRRNQLLRLVRQSDLHRVSNDNDSLYHLHIVPNRLHTIYIV